MPRPKQTLPTPAPGAAESQLDRLIDAVETVAEQLQVLREVIDEIREEFQWAIRNDRLRCPGQVVHVTSMPADPCAEDWAERVNRLTAEDLPSDDASAEPRAESSGQRSLFSSPADES
jgi:hypothetical protein